MKIKDSMKKEVISIPIGASIGEAAALMVEKRVGTLPVVDTTGKLIGVLGITDILRQFLPDFLQLLEDVDFVKDYGALEKISLEEIERVREMKVEEIMSEPIFVEEEAELIRALSLMGKHNLRDLPVAKEGRLVGIASRVDVGRRLLQILEKK